MGNYLDAAREVLLRFGRPMHYTSITSAAINLGLLSTRSSTPAISMSVALSREIRDNPLSEFRRVRGGVFELVTTNSTQVSHTRESDLRVRVVSLATMVGAPHPHVLLRRALFLLRLALDLSAGSPSIILSGRQHRFSVDLSDLSGLQVLSRRHFKNKRTSLDIPSFQVPREILLSAAQLRNRIGASTVHQVLEHALALVEVAMCVQTGGTLTLECTTQNRNFTLFSQGGDRSDDSS